MAKKKEDSKTAHPQLPDTDGKVAEITGRLDPSDVDKNFNAPEPPWCGFFNEQFDEKAIMAIISTLIPTSVAVKTTTN